MAAKDEMMRTRIDQERKARYRLAATRAGYGGVSAWVRDTLDYASDPESGADILLRDRATQEGEE